MACCVHSRTDIRKDMPAIRNFHDACGRLGVGAVVVLGHTDHNPRFGFTPAARFGIGCEFQVPENALVALEPQPDYLVEASGAVEYH